MRLNGKKVFIVGGASEMAEAIIAAFLKEGAQIVITDINIADMERILEKSDANEKLSYISGNVTKLDDMKKAVDFANDKMSGIDVMIYTAGIIRHMPIINMTSADWTSVLDVNLTGCFNACKAVAPIMENQMKGCIINVSSVGGRTARNVGVNYSASKAGIIGISQTLSLELAPYNVTVNVIAPGPLKGKMFETMEPERINVLKSAIPLKRLGTMKDDIAPLAVYLASDEAAWMTGEVIDINGGCFV